jgi:hypothetical protein
MGNLVLSPSKSNEKGIAKRFHLTDFHAPYAPDQDRQELPNSVVFDFVDGRTLQCACETRTVQAHVLQGESRSHLRTVRLLTLTSPPGSSRRVACIQPGCIAYHFLDL